MSLEAGQKRARGAAVEAWVATRLEAEGWRILDRNFTVRGGEIDLVAERGGVRAFIEIRSRSSDAHGSAAATVGVLKRRRLRLAARHWLARHDEGQADLRFDVVTVRLERGRPVAFEHLEAAFRMDA